MVVYKLIVLAVVASWIVATGAVTAAADVPSLDDLLGLTSPAAGPSSQPTGGLEESPKTRPPAMEPGLDMPRQLVTEQSPDVLGQAVNQMGEVAHRLGERLDAGLNTQRLQESILAKLDQVIEAAQKQALGSGGSSPPSGQAQQQEFGSIKNTRASQDQTGTVSQPGGAGSGSGGVGQVTEQRESAVMQGHRSQWGNLPERIRSELLEGLNEPFSSVYRELTGQYYRRLAQEGQ